MPFSSITSGSDTYVAREPGIYAEDSLVFSDPSQELRIRGATRNKDKTLSGSITWYLEKDVTVSGVSVRKSTVIATSVTSGPDFTVAELQKGIKAIYDYSQTSGFLSRFMQGES